jgi:hypothetical protein
MEEQRFVFEERYSQVLALMKRATAISTSLLMYILVLLSNT